MGVTLFKQKILAISSKERNYFQVSKCPRFLFQKFFKIFLTEPFRFYCSYDVKKLNVRITKPFNAVANVNPLCQYMEIISYLTT